MPCLTTPRMTLPAAAALAATLAIAFAMALALPMANATPICRWVDKAGRTQVASVVPEPYKAAATCTDSQKYELSAAQRRAAEQSVEQDKAMARIEAAKRPVEVVTGATDCPTWWRLFDENAECFGPYRTTRGATKQEAFDVCNVVPSPAPKCGPRSN
jgi:hypothetical protein